MLKFKHKNGKSNQLRTLELLTNKSLSNRTTTGKRITMELTVVCLNVTEANHFNWLHSCQAD